MADPVAVWTIIAIGGVGTYLLRLSFLALFERIGSVPPRVEYTLRFVPAAVLAALVAPAVVFADGGGSAIAPAQLLAGAVAAVVAYRTESIVATIVVGLGVLVVFQAVSPF